MSRAENTNIWPDCPVGIRKISAEELNKPRRGDTLIDAAKVDTQSAKESTRNSEPEFA